MAEPGDTLLKILDTITRTHTQLVDSLLRMEQRQQESNLALAQAIGENTQLLAKGIEENSRALAAMLQGMETRMADRDRLLAEILERVVQTTTRTEQMTARVLTELSSLSSRGESH